MSDEHHDWSVNELFAPIWLDASTCVCVGDVPRPFGVSHCYHLNQSESFGTGGHPVTQDIFRILKRVIKTLPRRARVLEVDSGTGLLPVWLKRKFPRLEVAAIVDAHETSDFFENMIKNHVEQIEVVPFHQFGNDESLNLNVGRFDLIFTQRGQVCWQIPFDAALSYLTRCLKPDGVLIYGGFPVTELPLAHHVFGEFLNVRELSVNKGWPIMIGSPRQH
jgi:ribosomal protein L11 methylase PrmA